MFCFFFFKRSFYTLLRADLADPTDNYQNVVADRSLNTILDNNVH